MTSERNISVPKNGGLQSNMSNTMYAPGGSQFTMKEQNQMNSTINANDGNPLMADYISEDFL